jgi:hypothetical protein
VKAAAFDRDRLVAAAIDACGSDNLGEPAWQEGLDHLLDALGDEGRLNEVGMAMVEGDVVGYLSNRIRINQWRVRNPEVARGRIDAPIVIVGQARSGTTILYDLLAQDPIMRAPLTWEVDQPLPPPRTATYFTDPRIAESQASLDLADAVLPGFSAFHPMGARLPQECVRITGSDFRSMIFPTQYHVPAYGQWLLYEADMASTYRWHRRFLQHLQSEHPARRWLLKTPGHIWHIGALLAEYPDAVLIQTHRDPLRLVASVSALTAHLRSMASDHTSVAESAAEFAPYILDGLDRSMQARDDGVLRADQVVDVQFLDFMRDPIATIATIYGRLGLELSADAEARMRAFLQAHPGDGGGESGRYNFAATELDAAELRERSRPYQERFGVASEAVI